MGSGEISLVFGEIRVRVRGMGSFKRSARAGTCARTNISGARAVLGSQHVRLQSQPRVDSVVPLDSQPLRAEDGSRSVGWVRSQSTIGAALCPRNPYWGWVALALLAPCMTWAQKVPVVEKTLANGMKLLLVERHDEPSVAGGWVAHVGSSNERPGITGIAHLFEHMMFKGTPTIGTKNYQKDLEIIAAQERVRDEMRQEEKKMRVAYRHGEIEDLLKPENKSPRYRELEAQFNKLITEQRDILVKNEFDRIYSGAGASSMNAFTSDDMTAYFINVPANKLELWMWMESERILHPVFREFYAERDVVFEERRMRTDSTPLGKFEEEFSAMFWEWL